MDKYGLKIWMNGQLVDTKDAKVSVMSHAIHYASSVFEGIKSYYIPEKDQQIIFRLDEHIDRLFNSASLYNFEIPYDKKTIKTAIIELVELNKGQDLYIRPCFFMGTGFDTIQITENTQKNLIVACWHIPRSSDTDYTLTISSYIRPNNNILLIESKCSANYMNSILIRNEAQQKGFNDAIALNSEGYIAEVSTANIFFIKDNQIYTPSTKSSILNGITRQSLITISKELNITINEGSYTVGEIKASDCIFICGTASELKVVSKLDEKQLETNELYTKLKSYFWSIINLEDEKYVDWITYVY